MIDFGFFMQRPLKARIMYVLDFSYFMQAFDVMHC